ncbi:MAG: bifunctional demethylmenaquinone methyltransferase/2-methoxy-6-polyprenyl-1,4-benzoquinol methylase UbiE [Thermodesulfobacteriota bacterium]
MQERKSIWYDRSKRLEQLDDHIIRQRKARFGSEELAESKKADRVRRHFDSVADRYDLMNTLLSMGIHYAWKQFAIQNMGLKPGDRVLDVCGGTGDLSVSALKAVGDTGQVVLYDINWRMMQAGKHKPTHQTYRRKIEYVQGDAEQIAFPDETFDRVMVGFAIRNITHMVRAFQEMYRVLKPGGVFMCLEFSKPVTPWFRWLYDFYSFHIMPHLGDLLVGTRQAYTCLPETIRLFLMPEELSDIFRRIGYTDVRFKRLTNGIAVVHIATK